MEPTSLDQFLRQLHATQPGIRETYERADAAGVPLHVLLDHVDFDEWPNLYEQDGTLIVALDVWPEDWVMELVDYCGGVDQAQHVLDKTTRWRDLSIAHQIRIEGLRAAANHGVAEGAPLREILALLREADHELDYLYTPVLKQTPVSTLVTEPAVPAEQLKLELERRGLSTALAHQLFNDLGDSLALNVLEEHYGRRGTGASEGERAVDVLAGLHVEEGRTLWDLRLFAQQRISAASWLQVFYRHRFSASFCALAALESEGGLLRAALLLKKARISDEDIFTGLLAAGAGPTPLLRTLHQSQWEPSRLVAAMRASGALDPEIREAVLQLGVSADDVQALLTTHLEHP